MEILLIVYLILEPSSFNDEASYMALDSVKVSSMKECRELSNYYRRLAIGSGARFDYECVKLSKKAK